jgi:hypothetical protein
MLPLLIRLAFPALMLVAVVMGVVAMVSLLIPVLMQPTL